MVSANPNYVTQHEHQVKKFLVDLALDCIARSHTSLRIRKHMQKLFNSVISDPSWNY
jgi:hypothetical protein